MTCKYGNLFKIEMFYLRNLDKKNWSIVSIKVIIFRHFISILKKCFSYTYRKNIK